MFHFSARSSTFMSTESNQSEGWFDRLGMRCQSPAWVFRKKIENINVHTFSSSLEILGSNSKLSHLVKDWTLTFQKIG